MDFVYLALGSLIWIAAYGLVMGCAHLQKFRGYP